MRDRLLRLVTNFHPHIPLMLDLETKARAKWTHMIFKIGEFTMMKYDFSHLSKRPSDLKQNGTQEKTPFSGTVFNTLSHGVIRFAASVSSKNHLLTG